MSAFVPSAFAGHRLPVSTSCVRGSGQSDDKAHDTLSEKGSSQDDPLSAQLQQREVS